MARRGQGETVTSDSDTEESPPMAQIKRKKVTKQTAAQASIQQEENKERYNEDAIQEPSSEYTPEQSDTDDKTHETDSTVTE